MSDYQYKVSALVSIYNSKRFLRHCMEDLCGQTLFQQGQLELILVDTGSDEYEADLISDYLQQYPDQIQYYRSYDRKPLYQAWNIAIKLARGQYLTNANTDDRHAPECLEVLARHLDEDSSIDLAYADSYVSKLENESWDDFKGTQRLFYTEYTPEESLLFCQFGPQPMWRATVHNEIGYFSDTLKAAGDWDFDIRFSLAGLKAKHINQVLGLYLQHEQAISFRDSTMANENKLVKNTFRTVENIIQAFSTLGYPTQKNEDRSLLLAEMGFRSLAFLPAWRYGKIQHDFDFAHFCFLEALKLNNQSNWSWFGVYLIECAAQNRVNQEDLIRRIDPNFRQHFPNFFSPSQTNQEFINWISQRNTITPLKFVPQSPNNTEPNSLSIVHLNTHDCQGGAAKIATLLQAGQSKANLDSKLLVGTRKNANNWTIEFPQNVNIEDKANAEQQGLLYHEYRDTIRIGKHPLVNNADIIHIHNLHGGWFHPQGLRSLHSSQKPIVWTLHDLQSITGRCAHPFECERWKTGCGECPKMDTYPKVTIDNSAYLWQEKQSLYQSMNLHLVAPSKWVADKIGQSILSEHPITIIPNGVDANIFKKLDKTTARKNLGLREDQKYCLFIADGGLNNSFKGGKVAIEILRALTDEFPDLHLLVKGQRSNPRIPISEKDLSRITFLPFDSNEHTIALCYNAADLFINPTLADTFSLSTCEAMACECPSVSFAADAIPELISHEHNGLLVPPGNIPKFIENVRLLLENPTYAKQLAEAGQKKFHEKFTLEHMVANYHNLYQSLGTKPQTDHQSIINSPSEQKESKQTRSTIRELLTQWEKNPNESTTNQELAHFYNNTGKSFLAYYHDSQNFPLEKDKFPTINLVIPNFNQGKYIDKCIQSILNENYPALNLIIIDGGSTDNSVDIIKKYQNQLSYWVSEKDKGQSDAINKGIAQSRGEIFNWICSDDWIEPGGLYAVAQMWSENPDAAAWVGAANRILEKDNSLYYISYPNGLTHEQILYNFTARSFYQPACFVNLKTLNSINGVRNDLHFTMDFDLFVRLSKLGKFYSSNHIICSTLSQPDAKTVKSMRSLWEEKIKLHEEYGSLEAIPNLKRRLNDKSDWNYVIPPSSKNHLGKLPEPLSLLPTFSQCRNRNCTKVAYIQIIIDSEVSKDELEYTLKEIIPRQPEMKIIVSGPKWEIYSTQLSHPNLKFTPTPSFERNEQSFCQAVLFMNNNASQVVQSLNQGLVIITPQEVTLASDKMAGIHLFSGRTLKEQVFQLIQTCYEPSVWGYFVDQNLKHMT